eukprot:Amastigsp_a510172_18.p2 type:complete len:143 gc:universal Amastigsp_a510172_18:1073-645(-)
MDELCQQKPGVRIGRFVRDLDGHAEHGRDRVLEGLQRRRGRVHRERDGSGHCLDKVEVKRRDVERIAWLQNRLDKAVANHCSECVALPRRGLLAEVDLRREVRGVEHREEVTVRLQNRVQQQKTLGAIDLRVEVVLRIVVER